ncbi:MAG: TRAP transporter small permease [Proteobacteria bacterium]|nr:TRAP transporter small permease [Pseudomonadota bacterium]
MERLQSLAETVARGGVYVGCGLLILAAGLIGVEVVARKIFQVSVGGADELASYALAISMAWGYAYALFERAHVRVDAVYVRFSPWLRAVLDLVSLLAFALVIGLLCLRAVGVLGSTLEMHAISNTSLGTPLVIPQSLWLLGLVFFLLCILVLLARVAAALTRRDLATIQRLAGAPSLSEEMAGAGDKPRGRPAR